MDNFLGQTFIWWIGVVEDISDPNQIGRVRVRIFGLHPQDVSLVPTEDLPWMPILLPANAAFNSASGNFPNGLSVGTHVIGFFLDGENGQHGMVIGTFLGSDDATAITQFSKTAGQARQSGVDSNSLFTEPSVYNPQYPYNAVENTRSGHLFETDDTAGSERILTQHKSGTFQELQPDGSMVTKITGKGYEIVASDNNIHIKGVENHVVGGNENHTVGGKLTITVQGDVHITSSGGNINLDGNGIMDRLVKLEKLEAKFNTHRHIATAPAIPTSLSGIPDRFIDSNDGTQVVSAA
jgi:Gp5-like OB domain-containing protein